MSTDYEFDLDTECGSLFERARRRAGGGGLVNIGGYNSNCSVIPPNTADAETSGCGPALNHLDPHRRELHDVPLLEGARADYTYLHEICDWWPLAAAFAALRRAWMRWQIAAMVPISDADYVLLMVWVGFVFGIWVGRAH